MLAIVTAPGEHGLDDAHAGELLQALDHALDSEASGGGAIEDAHCGFHSAVEFEDVVIYFSEGLGYFGGEDAGGVGKDTDLDLGIVFVA